MPLPSGASIRIAEPFGPLRTFVLMFQSFRSMSARPVGRPGRPLAGRLNAGGGMGTTCPRGRRTGLRQFAASRAQIVDGLFRRHPERRSGRFDENPGCSKPGHSNPGHSLRPPATIIPPPCFESNQVDRQTGEQERLWAAARSAVRLDANSPSCEVACRAPLRPVTRR